MKILFLDDDESRHRIFRARSVGAQVDHVHDAESCIKSLETGDHDLVFLDHDLGGEESQMRLDCDTDGRTVARYIASNANRFAATTFVIHSLNPNGSLEMQRLILDQGLTAHRIPFAWRTFSLVNGVVSF